MKVSYNVKVIHRCTQLYTKGDVWESSCSAVMHRQKIACRKVQIRHHHAPTPWLSGLHTVAPTHCSKQAAWVTGCCYVMAVVG